MIPFIDAEAENITNEDAVISYFWQQKRFLLTGKFAGGNHIINYGIVENHGDNRLKAVRFLHPGKIVYARDLSAHAWSPGRGPDPQWKIRRLEKISTAKTTTLSVLIPYPQGYTYLKGPCRTRMRMGTVKENRITINHPPSPLNPNDMEFKEILRKADLIFSDKFVETADRKLYVRLGPLYVTEIIQELNLEPGEARFFSNEIFIPNMVSGQTSFFSTWITHGPLALISGLSTEINQLRSNIAEFDASRESIDRFQRLVSRLKNGRCEIEEFWLSMILQAGYASTENSPSISIYLHEEKGNARPRVYISKTWIFKDEEVDFYLVHTIHPIENRLRATVGEPLVEEPLVLDKSYERLGKGFDYFDRQFRILGFKINGVNSLIRKLSQKVATKEDFQQMETLLVENQRIIQEILKEKIDDIRPEIEIEIEQKIDKKEASRFWRILEKLSTIGGALEFAKCVKELVDFLNEHKIIHTVLPLLLNLLTVV